MKGNWVEKLLNVLWAYRTTPKRSTSETPFSMTYGTKVVILIEIPLLSLRVADSIQSHIYECMIKNLDALEKRRGMVPVRLVDYQHKLAQRYNRKVRPREFVARDLVLWRAVESMKDHNASKLALN